MVGDQKQTEQFIVFVHFIDLASLLFGLFSYSSVSSSCADSCCLVSSSGVWFNIWCFLASSAGVSLSVRQLFCPSLFSFLTLSLQVLHFLIWGVLPSFVLISVTFGLSFFVFVMSSFCWISVFHLFCPPLLGPAPATILSFLVNSKWDLSSYELWNLE